MRLMLPFVQVICSKGAAMTRDLFCSELQYLIYVYLT